MYCTYWSRVHKFAVRHFHSITRYNSQTCVLSSGGYGKNTYMVSFTAAAGHQPPPPHHTTYSHGGAGGYPSPQAERKHKVSATHSNIGCTYGTERKRVYWGMIILISFIVTTLQFCLISIKFCV
jgi:hypothetical protein